MLTSNCILLPLWAVTGKKSFQTIFFGTAEASFRNKTAIGSRPFTGLPKCYTLLPHVCCCIKRPPQKLYHFGPDLRMPELL